MNTYVKMSVVLLLFALSNKSNGQTAFSVGPVTNNYTLTCSNPVITFTAYSGTTPFNYTWTCASFSTTGNVAYVTTPGTWSITGHNLISNAISTQTFFINQNLSSPNVTITPAAITLTCNIPASSFTGLSDLGPNVTTNWFKVYGTNTVYVGVQQGTLNLYTPSSEGIYYFESKLNSTGCVATASVSVIVTGGMPQFSLSSPGNFSVGCASLSLTSIQVSSVITSPPTNTLVNYAFVPPPAIAPPVYSSNNIVSNVNTPGLWVVYVKDMTNNCVSSHSFSILQNTVAPLLGYMKPVSMITCFSPSMQLTAYSNHVNNPITWTVPAVPSSTIHPGASLTLSMNLSVLNATVAYSSLGVFTLDVVSGNLCRSSTTLQIPQDVRVPVFTVSAVSNSVITCNFPSVLLSVNAAPSVTAALVPTYTWYPPSGPAAFGNQYNTILPGVHQVVSSSTVNGCGYLYAYTVGLDNVVAAFSTTIAVSCPPGTISVSPGYPNGTSNLTFVWTGPPGSIASFTDQSTIVANATGEYTCIVTNTVNGCTKTVTCLAACNTGLLSNSVNTNSIRVFPNPSNGKLTIEAGMNATAFVLFDLQGKQLLEKEIKGISNTLELSFAKGFYFYQIKDGDRVLKKDKLIIE